MRRLVLGVLTALLLCTPMAVPAAGTPSVPGDGSATAGSAVVDDRRAAQARAQPAVNVTYTYRRLPDEPGVVGVTMGLSAEQPVDGVAVTFRDDVTVTGTTNVDREGRRYAWDGGSVATVDYRLPVDWKYTGNSGDAWTLLEHRSPRVEADADVVEQVDAVDGYVGNRTLLLGAHEVYDRAVDGERIELVVPAGVEPLYGPARTVDALANASRALQVGGRAPVVHAFVTPEIENDVVPFVQPGFGLDDRTLLVDADSRLDVWTHEYVHTRQAFARTDGLRWLVEGSAEYYGWLLSVEQGYDGWSQLQQVFRQTGDDAVLADPGTWSGEVDYFKGAHVLAVVDREVRAATGGDRTLQAVLRRVNDDDATLDSFVEAVREVGGEGAAETAARLATTDATPAYQPDVDKLRAVYGYDAPAVRVEQTRLSAVGPDWRRSLDAGRRRLRVGAGETVRFETRVTNDGNRTAVAAVAPRVSASEGDLSRVDEPWVGRVDPGETLVRTATHQFDSPGLYELRRRGFLTTVQVVPERGTAAVVDLSVAVTDRQARVDATVRNTDSRPTFVRLPIERDGRQVRTAALVVDGETKQTVTVLRNLSTRTPTTVTVGNVSTTVGESAATKTPVGPGGTDQPTQAPQSGLPEDAPAVLFGAVVLILAALVVRRSRDE